MIGARVGDHRLIHVVATEAIGRQDHEANGARETNVLEDGIQGRPPMSRKLPVSSWTSTTGVTGLLCFGTAWTLT